MSTMDSKTLISQVYSEPSHTCKIEVFVTIVNDIQQLLFLAFDIWLRF